MKIAINAVLSYDKPRGVGVYFDTFILELAKIDHENEYFVFYGEWMKYRFLEIQEPNFHLIPLKIRRGKVMRNLYLTFRFPSLLKKYGIDFLHNIDTTPVLFRPTPIVSTIHDLSEFFLPEKYGKLRAFIRRTYVKKQIRKSTLIMTPSEYSKNTIAKLGKKDLSSIVVVPNSVPFVPKEVPPRPSSHDLLFVGEIERTKNVEVIVRALPLLPDDFRLIVAGKPGNDFEGLMNLVQELKLESRVDMKGYVSLEELNRLYDTAWLFVFPSLFEGFGIPLIEAMSHSLPVVSSTSTCLPEVGGDACLYFDPHDPLDLSKVILRLSEDKALYDSLIAKGLERGAFFTKEKMAAQILDVYRAMPTKRK